MLFFFHREYKAVIVNHSLGDKLLCAATDELIESYTPQGEGKINADIIIQSNLRFCANTSPQRPVFQNITERFQVKLLHLEPLVSDNHLYSTVKVWSFLLFQSP